MPGRSGPFKAPAWPPGRISMRAMRPVLIGLFSMLLSAAGPLQAQGADRPKVGLVLGGGGARGAAHIGVLEVLERLRVPVDCVAGTSMGALIAGAWAAGLSPATMRQELARADWADMFQDNPDYTELNFRNKRLSQRFLPGSETGILAGSAVTPPGVVSGQKIKLFFNHLVRADAGERELQQLPLPVSIVATDIGTGERVVYRDGSLTLAMRASMSVPGLMAPLEYRGRKLVDGGLVDNVPIREVRERCQPDVVIAVNVGSPPLQPDQVSGLLSVTAQMVALLTEHNVSASLATLRSQDIYIKPYLGTISAGDFDRHAEAADHGRAAAEEAAVRLQDLSISETDYADWRRRMAVRERDVPRIDAVEVAGLNRVNAATVTRYLEQRDGAPLDTATLNRDLLRAYGDGNYERVDYTVLSQRGKNVLRVMPVEKSWGPDYVRLALQLDSNLSQGSTYQLRGGYQKTWLNPLGGELLFTGELGGVTGLGAAFYQPLDPAQRWFFDAEAESRRERVDYWVLDQRIAQYHVARGRIDLLAGVNLMLLGQVRLGWREIGASKGLETGVDLFADVKAQSSGGWLFTLDMDRLDRLYFPRSGWAAYASYYDSDRSGYSRAALEGRAVWPVQDWVLGTRASWIGSPRGQLPLYDAARLGGFLNLTGYASGQLLGDEAVYAHVRAERIISRAPLGLRGDLRLGVALEAGKIAQPYTLQKRNGWLNSLALYLGGESAFGPAYVGLGVASGGSVNAYLVIGAP